MKPAVQIIQRLYASPYFRIITILLFSGFLLYTNFCVNNYSTYPFYYNGDPDAYYAAPSIILANGGYLFSTIHPDGTAFSLYGGIYRVLSLFSEQHGLLNHFENIKSQYEAVKVLTAAVLSGRIISLVVIFFSVIFMSLILYHVTKHNYLIALSFSLCATTMPSVLLYTHILRADHISILFFVFGLSIIMLLYKTNIASLARYLLFYLLAGVMFGFAILAKIQIMPLVFSCILFIFTFELIFNRDNIPNTFNDLLIANIAVAALAAVIFPWWGLTKPRYLTHSFYTSLGFDFHRLYGNLPDKIISPVVIICALLLLIPISLYFFRLISQSKIIERLSVVCLIGNVVCLGIIISSYLVLVPVSSSFETYIHNTRHLIYSTVLQVFNTLTGYGGYLEHIDGISIGWFQKFTSIISQHGANSPLAGINLLYFVALSLAVCLYRLIFRKKEITWKFFIPIYLFITAFFMDYLSAMRLSKFLLYFHYMIFSIFIYVFGIFYTFYLECYGAGRSLNSPDLGFSWVLLSKRGFVYSLVVIYFAVYLGQLSFPSPSLGTSPRHESLSEPFSDPC